MSDPHPRLEEPGDGIIVTRPKLCPVCRHLDRENPEMVRCHAFPNGIPVEILTNRHDHHNPHPDDMGIQFEPLEEDDPAS